MAHIYNLQHFCGAAKTQKEFIMSKIKLNGAPGASVVVNGEPGSAIKVAMPLSSDKSLAVWSYSANAGYGPPTTHAVTAGMIYSVPNAYSNTAILAFVQTPTDGGASVSQLSGSALNVGPNTYTSRVTAADGSHADYSITLIRSGGGSSGGGGRG